MKYSELDLGTIEDVVDKLGGREGVQLFLNGDTTVVAKEHIIDCDANPYVPNNFKIKEHQKGGQIHWNPDKFELYLCDKQKEEGFVDGNELCKLLKGEPVLNACVLDDLLANPQLIPEELKDKFVLFWGTIYSDSNGNLCIRYLYFCWGEHRWNWNYYRLDNKFSADYFVALFRK